jgi:hypothetical protein
VSEDPEWVEQVRADLRQRKDADDFRHYKSAAPLCDKHQPDGGTRGVCVICSGESLQAALSRISYACEPQNAMQCSSYDVHMDETAVVAQVVAQAERIRVLREALEKLTACKAVEIRLRQLHEMGHGTDYDQHRQQFADAWVKARAALEATK